MYCIMIMYLFGKCDLEFKCNVSILQKFIRYFRSFGITGIFKETRWRWRWGVGGTEMRCAHYDHRFSTCRVLGFWKEIMCGR